MENVQSEMSGNSSITKECPAPIELTFMDHASNWYESLTDDDANKLINGISLPAMLVLFKHFPDNEVIKSLLHSKL